LASAKSAFCVQCLAVIAFVAFVCCDTDGYRSTPWLGLFLESSPGRAIFWLTFFLGIGLLGPIIHLSRTTRLRHKVPLVLASISLILVQSFAMLTLSR